MRTCDNGATNDDSCTDRNVAIISDDSSNSDNEGTGAYIMLLMCGALLPTNIVMLSCGFFMVSWHIAILSCKTKDMRSLDLYIFNEFDWCVWLF